MENNTFKIQTDCFAYIPNKSDPRDRCSALNDLYCAKEKCKFYKPKKEVK